MEGREVLKEERYEKKWRKEESDGRKKAMEVEEGLLKEGRY